MFPPCLSSDISPSNLNSVLKDVNSVPQSSDMTTEDGKRDELLINSDKLCHGNEPRAVTGRSSEIVMPRPDLKNLADISKDQKPLSISSPKKNNLKKTVQGTNLIRQIKKENSTPKRQYTKKVLPKKEELDRTPVALRTGELTLKIFSDKASCQQKLNGSYNTDQIVCSGSDEPAGGLREKRIEVDRAVDDCPACKCGFAAGAIGGSVFCLKTGNVVITCTRCSAVTLMRHSFRGLSSP